MPKAKTLFVCNACGYETGRWLGQCPGCHAWNTLEEVPVALAQALSRAEALPAAGAQAIRLSEVDLTELPRFSAGFSELDRVLGGGVVPGSLVLLGGDPGIGKSTLLLQSAATLAQKGGLLYVTGEESPAQVRMRAQRLGVTQADIWLYPQTDCGMIEAEVKKRKPGSVVIDSVQTLISPEQNGMPGSIVQLREGAGRMMRLAKETGCAIFLIGHVNKEGGIAGPRVLEHIVDAVLYLEGDRGLKYRILRAAKNRFGSTNEIGLFEMKDEGLVQVDNPSEILISPRAQQEAGSVVVCPMEGTRAMLVEMQALVSPTSFGTPRRMSTGFDYGRMAMLIAVLEKRAGLPLGNQDAYLNVAGGLRLDEPAADLGVIAAIASGFTGLAVGAGTAVFGEVGLTGEVRAVSRAQTRLAECAKLGMHRVLMPQDNLAGLKVPEGIDVIGVRTVSQAIQQLLPIARGSRAQ
nr:DNA repair protein RadA [bacterium]